MPVSGSKDVLWNRLQSIKWCKAPYSLRGRHWVPMVNMSKYLCDDNDLRMMSPKHARKMCLEKYESVVNWKLAYDRWVAQKLREAQERERVQQVITMARQYREDTLKAALQERGCVLRSDSFLCNNYIDHGIGLPEMIAVTMEEMKFYYEHTRYRTFYLSIKQSDLQEGWDAFDDEWSSDDEYWAGPQRRPWVELDYESIVRRAKSLALREWVRTFPSMFHALNDPCLPVSLHEAVANEN